MDWWYDRKARRMVIRAAGLLVLMAGSCLLYSYYKAWNLSDYEMQNSYTGLRKPVDSARHSESRSFTVSQPESQQKMSAPDSQAIAYNHPNTSSTQTFSPAPARTVLLGKKEKDSSDIKIAKTTGTLQGPSALFSHEYTVGIGKTVPVNISWEDAGAASATFRLVTIKVNDITDGKAMFTIEDPFNVLLFSQTKYGVNDKIIIADDRHNITLSVLQVNASAVVVRLVSQVNESIISKLQEAP